MITDIPRINAIARKLHYCGQAICKNQGNEENSVFEKRAEWLLSGKKRKWDGCGGRILLGENTSGETAVLHSIMFQNVGVWIANGLRFTYVGIHSFPPVYSVPNCAKFELRRTFWNTSTACRKVSVLPYSGFESRRGQEIFRFSQTPTTTLRSSQPFTPRVTTLSPGLKRPGRESHPSI
jgi:hypothetical protein